MCAVVYHAQPSQKAAIVHYQKNQIFAKARQKSEKMMFIEENERGNTEVLM